MKDTLIQRLDKAISDLNDTKEQLSGIKDAIEIQGGIPEGTVRFVLNKAQTASDTSSISTHVAIDEIASVYTGPSDKYAASDDDIKTEIGGWRIEKLHDGRIFRIIFPFIGYKKNFNHGRYLPDQQGRYTRVLLLNMIKKFDMFVSENEDILADTEHIFQHPYLYFLFHLDKQKRALDADNLETKKMIDVLDGHFFEGDSVDALMTTFFGTKDKYDFTELFICDRKDFSSVTAEANASIELANERLKAVK